MALPLNTCRSQGFSRCHSFPKSSGLKDTCCGHFNGSILHGTSVDTSSSLKPANNKAPEFSGRTSKGKDYSFFITVSFGGRSGSDREGTLRKKPSPKVRENLKPLTPLNMKFGRIPIKKSVSSIFFFQIPIPLVFSGIDPSQNEHFPLFFLFFLRWWQCHGVLKPNPW